MIGSTARGSYAVELQDLTESKLAQDLTARFQPSEPTLVQDLALISDIEEITEVAPDTIVLLSNHVSAGGWMVSAALRYAWERRACAVLAPEQAVTEATVELARRLNVALLTTTRDVTQLSIALAIQLGIARAGVMARVQAFVDEITQAATPTALAAQISREFGGARVQIRVSGTVTLDFAESAPSSDVFTGDGGDGDPIIVEIPQGVTSAELVLIGTGRRTREYAEQALRAAVPIFRSLLFESRLNSILDSLPAMSIASLIGSTELGLLDAPSREAALRGAHTLGERYRTVCILAAEPASVGAVVHHIWQRFYPEVPLTAIADGWLAFVPTAGRVARDTIVNDVRAGFGEVGPLGAGVGVAEQRSSPTELLESVREAWLAARMAWPERARETNVIEFAEIPSRLLDRLVPAELADKLAARMFPDLMGDAASGEIIEAVVTFLSARGSVSRAAEMLGVHRNTLQTRLRRADELGVPLADPTEVLSVHMLLASVLRNG